MTYFITNAYMLALAAECLMVFAVCLRLAMSLVPNRFAERFARSTASLVLFLAAACLIYTWPRGGPNEVLSRMLAHDLPAWIAKMLLLVGAMAALRATRANEQPQLFLTAAIAGLLASSNDLLVAALALEGLMLGSLATARARVASGLFLLSLAAVYVQIAATDLGTLYTARASAPESILLLFPPLCAAGTGMAYLSRPQGRYAWLVLVGVTAFVARYAVVVFGGAALSRGLQFLH